METTQILIHYNQILTLSESLLSITEVINHLARKGQVVQVAVRIGKRQDIIDQLKMIEKRLIPMIAIQKDLGKSIAPWDNTAIQSCVNRIRKILENVKLLDLEISTFVDHEQKKVAMELKTVSNNHALIKKYIPSRRNTPEYFSLSI